MNARDLPAVIDACTADLKAANDLDQHLRDRDAELSEDLITEGPQKHVELKCGCVARLVEDCDGDTAWTEWRWRDDECSVIGGAA